MALFRIQKREKADGIIHHQCLVRVKKWQSIIHRAKRHYQTPSSRATLCIKSAAL